MCNSDIIFLLGAGASRPAGIPTIPEMTKDFLEKPLRYSESTNYTNLESDVTTLADVTQDYYGKKDLELIMSLILMFQDSQFRKLLESKYKEMAKIDEKHLGFIKNLINGYIRKECENIDSNAVEYLWPLQGLIYSDKLKIFTLNYDGTIEIFCEKNNIDFSDGFNQYWDPKSFEKTKVNLFKLHGSLYWFRTESGKIIKVPVKGLTVRSLKYLSDESVSEMMIYPALQKNKQSEVYLWLHGTFINQLNVATTCIIIGYSFRDEDIVNNIIDALNRNPDLWLIIISPNASDYKNKHFTHPDLASRVVTISKKIQDVVTNRKLDGYIQSLKTARAIENDMWKRQYSSPDRVDAIEKTINNYRRIGYVDPIQHEDRIRWINEKLAKRIA